MKIYYTDYPFAELGDTAFELAPIRPCYILEYDGDKYAKIFVSGTTQDVKMCYIYDTERRLEG